MKSTISAKCSWVEVLSSIMCKNLKKVPKNCKCKFHHCYKHSAHKNRVHIFKDIFVIRTKSGSTPITLCPFWLRQWSNLPLGPRWCQNVLVCHSGTFLDRALRCMPALHHETLFSPQSWKKAVCQLTTTFWGRLILTQHAQGDSADRLPYISWNLAVILCMKCVSTGLRAKDTDRCVQGHF